MGFVGNCAPCGLSPQTDGMPVILTKAPCFAAQGADTVLRCFFLSLHASSKKRRHIERQIGDPILFFLISGMQDIRGIRLLRVLVSKLL